MKEFISSTFGRLDFLYTIKNYIIGGFVYYVYATQINYGSNAESIYVILIINYLLYPFAMFVNDSISKSIFGERKRQRTGSNKILGFLWIIKISLTYAFSTLIACIGMYHFYTTRND